jgi:hypothetical protein
MNLPRFSASAKRFLPLQTSKLDCYTLSTIGHLCCDDCGGVQGAVPASRVSG